MSQPAMESDRPAKTSPRPTVNSTVNRWDIGASGLVQASIAGIPGKGKRLLREIANGSTVCAWFRN
jgi:hypothetical protein